MGQRFFGVVKAARLVGENGHNHLTLRFDTPIDVVRFSSFSSLRQQVSVTVDWTGRTPQKTSNGAPHMVLDI
jgi:hypothetical protein